MYMFVTLLQENISMNTFPLFLYIRIEHTFPNALNLGDNDNSTKWFFTNHFSWKFDHFSTQGLVKFHVKYYIYVYIYICVPIIIII